MTNDVADATFDRPTSVTIITLTIDTSSFVFEAIDSVEHNHEIPFEHIVVHDGQDAFVDDLVARYPHLKIVKGDGRGATAAAVRGVEAASGQFILLLHSDDRLRPGSLTQLAACAAARPDVRIWTGGMRIFLTRPDGVEEIVRVARTPALTELSLANVCDDLPLLTARFVHRSVYDQIGNFDVRFSESSDREFLLRAVMAGIVEAPLGVMVSDLRQHPDSRTLNKRTGWVPPYLAEHIRIADLWLVRSDISPAARGYLKNWRAREVLRCVVFYIRAGQWRSAFGLMLHAFRTDALWMFRTATTVASILRRRRNDKDLPEPFEAPIATHA